MQQGKLIIVGESDQYIESFNILFSKITLNVTMIIFVHILDLNNTEVDTLNDHFLNLLHDKFALLNNKIIAVSVSGTTPQFFEKEKLKIISSFFTKTAQDVELMKYYLRNTATVYYIPDVLLCLQQQTDKTRRSSNYYTRRMSLISKCKNRKMIFVSGTTPGISIQLC